MLVWRPAFPNSDLNVAVWRKHTSLLPEGRVSDQRADSLSVHAEVAEACEGDGR